MEKRRHQAPKHRVRPMLATTIDPTLETALRARHAAEGGTFAAVVDGVIRAGLAAPPAALSITLAPRPQA